MNTLKNSAAMPATIQFLRLPQVRARIGLSRSELYRRVNDGTFPKPVKLGKRSSAWASNEVDAWIAEVLAGRMPGSP